MRNKALFISVGVLNILAVLTLLYVTYVMFHAYSKLSITKEISLSTETYSRTDADGPNILVVGDSIAYGVGSTQPEASFAGYIGELYPSANIINRAEIGYDSEDMASNMSAIIDNTQYNTILIIVGGNDVIRFNTDLEDVRANLETAYRTASSSAKHVYTITSGDVREISSIPWGLESYFGKRGDRLREYAQEIAQSIDNVTYVDAYSINVNLSEYEALDGFHLNDDGARELANLTAIYMN